MQCPQDNNPHDCYAVAVCKAGTVIGHVPRCMSRLCWLFLKKPNTTIKCFVIANRRNSSDLVQGGLEVPYGKFLFTGGTPEQIVKVSGLFRSIDSSVCSHIAEE